MLKCIYYNFLRIFLSSIDVIVLARWLRLRWCFYFSALRLECEYFLNICSRVGLCRSIFPTLSTSSTMMRNLTVVAGSKIHTILVVSGRDQVQSPPRPDEEKERRTRERKNQQSATSLECISYFDIKPERFYVISLIFWMNWRVTHWTDRSSRHTLVLSHYCESFALFMPP